jgi:hypothetical protein
MLIPLNSPKTIDTIIMTTEMEKIDERRAMSLKCDHPGVVGENESCERKRKVKFMAACEAGDVHPALVFGLLMVLFSLALSFIQNAEEKKKRFWVFSILASSKVKQITA